MQATQSSTAAFRRRAVSPKSDAPQASGIGAGPLWHDAVVFPAGSSSSLEEVALAC
ncbi:hypothetical protein SAMN05421771_1960 [Granulicella pectinivorans]|uniref:Uncharacterized protein n=1 Tax=Granulicella pectinivorans TaxID=474950 RepID=A0A1I6M721_9BACT|nr:hypothetical protein SAMN05421771_1960 [Granulicella pectinivorans]